MAWTQKTVRNYEYIKEWDRGRGLIDRLVVRDAGPETVAIVLETDTIHDIDFQSIRIANDEIPALIEALTEYIKGV